MRRAMIEERYIKCGSTSDPRQASPAGWKGPLLMLSARPALALAAQALVATFFRLRGHPHPWRAAASWWMVYGTVVDVGCLIALFRLSHREGTRLTDLVSAPDTAPCPPLHASGDLVMLVGVALASSAVTRPLFGKEPYPPHISVVSIPPWATAYSITIWPVLWAITEEMTYLGYALPHLEACTGSTRTASAIVATCWAGQHVTMPLLPEGRYLAARAISATPLSAAFTALYVLRGRRLRPLIAAHWLSDLSAAILAAALPSIQRHARILKVVAKEEKECMGN